MTKQELLVDFITSLDGYAAAEGWPGWWGLEGPEYLAWLGQQPERDYTILMGANTYRQMYGFAAAAETLEPDEQVVSDELTQATKVVFSSTLQAPLPWDHREQRLRADLRRLSRCRPRHGCQPDVRWQASVAGVRPQGAGRSTWPAPWFLTVRGIHAPETSKQDHFK